MDMMHLSPRNDRLFAQYITYSDGPNGVTEYTVHGKYGTVALTTRHLRDALAEAARIDHNLNR